MIDPMDTTSQPRGRLRQRLFAWMHVNSRGEYEISNVQRKRALFGSLHGNVLEIGPGSGPNLRFYAPDVRWLGIEPNPYLHSHLATSIQETGRPAEHFRIERGDPRGVRLPAPDASMDAVVSTLVLCSVPDPQASLREILRVLKPGGKFVFIEHVAAPQGSWLRSFQNFLQPVWTLVGDGCHPNRETWETIERAGFARLELEHYRYPGGGPAAPHIAGAAYK
jgi:SAM-dependent methyltransferase